MSQKALVCETHTTLDCEAHSVHICGDHNALFIGVQSAIVSAHKRGTDIQTTHID